MAPRKKAPATKSTDDTPDETAEVATAEPEGETTSTAASSHRPDDVDRVAVPSIREDGTPDQTDGFEQLT